jgi:hypothetical protein
MFTRETIGYLETIAENVGLAVRNSLTHTRLKEALEEIKTLRGILPICCKCKKIRDDRGYWREVEMYLRERTDAEFSHGYCPTCGEAALREIRRGHLD